MYKEKIQYKDLDGNDVEGEFWFHLSTADILEMESEVDGGLRAVLQKMIEGKDETKVLAVLKAIVARSVGKKSTDGRRFLRTPEDKSDFLDSDAYSKFLLKLLTVQGAAVDFFNGIVPKDLDEQARAASGQVSVPTSTMTSIPESPLGEPGFRRHEFPGLSPEENALLIPNYKDPTDRDYSDWRSYSPKELLDLDDDFFNAIVGPVKPGMDKALLSIAMQRRNRQRGA